MWRDMDWLFHKAPGFYSSDIKKTSLKAKQIFLKIVFRIASNKAKNSSEPMEISI